MNTFVVLIYDIESIEKPKFLEEKSILADSKSEAQDKAHELAFSLYPDTKRMISLRVVNS